MFSTSRLPQGKFSYEEGSPNIDLVMGELPKYLIQYWEASPSLFAELGRL